MDTSFSRQSADFCFMFSLQYFQFHIVECWYLTRYRRTVCRAHQLGEGLLGSLVPILSMETVVVCLLYFGTGNGTYGIDSALNNKPLNSTSCSV